MKKKPFGPPLGRDVGIILEMGKKQYKPVIKYFQSMLAQAMRRPEEAPPTKKRKPRVSKKQLNLATIPDSIKAQKARSILRT